MEPIFSKSVQEQPFACDLLKCKGACCTISGGIGAPLRETEVKFVKEFQNLTLQFLPQKNQNLILQNKSVEFVNNQFVLNCIDNKDCIFVFYENNIAKCSFEKLYNQNMIPWKKPISCRLFPLRLRDGKLMFEPIDECIDGVKKGEFLKENLAGFLQKDLEAAFGKDWYIQNIENK